MYKSKVLTADLSPCHNVWCTLSLPQWLVLQVQNWTLHVLSSHSVPKYNFWCKSESVVWNEAELIPIVVDNYVTGNLTCGIGLEERKVCSGLLRLPFSVSSPKTYGLQSISKYSVTWVLWTGGVILFRLESGRILCWIQAYEHNTLYEYLI